MFGFLEIVVESSSFGRMVSRVFFLKVIRSFWEIREVDVEN